MRKRGKGITREQLISALKENEMDVPTIARKFKVTRQAIYWMMKHFGVKVITQRYLSYGQEFYNPIKN